MHALTLALLLHSAVPAFALRTTALTLAPSRPAVASVQMGLLNRFRRKRKVEAASQIAVGAMLPEVDVELVPAVSTEEGEGEGEGDGAATEVPSVAMPIAEALGNGTSVLIGMPGAFTPTCNDLHLPGYIKQKSAFEEAGVAKIAVVTTNDRYVNDAWNKVIGACVGAETDSSLQMLSDGDGDLVKALGLVDDMGFGVGTRSKRFALVCEDGVVKHVAVDEGMDSLESTSAESILEIVAPGTAELAAAELKKEEAQKLGALAAGALLIAAALYASMSGDVSSTDLAATTAAAAPTATSKALLFGKAGKTASGYMAIPP